METLNPKLLHVVEGLGFGIGLATWELYQKLYGHGSSMGF